MAALHLHLRFEYYDAIASGEKTEEYRLAEKWLKRIQGKAFDNVVLWRGYTRTKIATPWRGYDLKVITHKHFGAEPVEVCAICVRALDNPCIISYLTCSRLWHLRVMRRLCG